MLYNIWTIIFLCVNAFFDIKKRIVYPLICFINIGAAIIINLFLQNMSWLNILAGIGLGGMLFLISLCTKGGIGKGDALVIMAVGSIEGILTCFEITLLAFLICAAMSLIAMALKKLNLKSTLPLVPFMLAAAVIVFAQG